MTVPLDTLASYVPRLVIERLEADPAPLAEPREQQVAGALLFADIAGFSRLADQLAQNNPAGAEELTALLNDYFGHLIGLVVGHGGDVVKFAGDALLALWSVTGTTTTLEQAALEAAQCALAVQQQLADYQAGGRRLKLRISLVAGEFRIMELGGIEGRWEVMLAGEPLLEIESAAQTAEVGKVVVSPQAWKSLKSRSAGRSVGGGFVMLSRVANPVPVSPLPKPILRPDMEAGLRGSLPAVVFGRISAGQHDWMAELRQITVMFVNLPWLNSRIPLPAAQSAVETIERTVTQYQGSLNKLSMDDKGATAVVVFGLPTHEDDPVRAVLAARDLKDRLTDGERALHIGITTGCCFCGSVGSDLRREYTVIGNTVNIAARLMQHSQGRILCDALTHNLAHQRFWFVAHSSIQVKGIDGRPVEIFEPIKERQADPGSETDIVGQDRQREMIQKILDDCGCNKSACVVLIEGDAGIGKSRLTQHLSEAALNRGFTVLAGRGDSIEEASPYHVWRPVIGQLLEQIPSDAGASATPKDRLLNWLGTEEDLIPLAPLLGSILPLDIPENATTRDMVGQVRADNLQRLVVRTLRKKSAENPLLIVLDDGQWFDSASWAIARQVARQVPSVMLAVATRPLDDPRPADYLALKQMDHTIEILLNPLSDEETRRLICERLGVAQVPEEITNWIYQRAEGNPLYSEELVFVLRDSKKLFVKQDQAVLACRPSELATLDFPNALHGVVRSRFDRLGPPELLTVKTASVIGRSFEYRVLEHTYPVPADRDKLPSHVETVCRRDLILQTVKTPEPAYAFKHIVIQEVAYQLMLFKQRRALHQAIAQWYEAATERNSATTFALLAYHWNQAGVEDKARLYEEKAGDHALKNGAYQEAAEFFQAVVDRMPPAAIAELDSAERLHRASLHRRLAASLMGLGRLEDSREECLAALKWIGEAAPIRPASCVPRLLLQTATQIWHRLRKGRLRKSPKAAAFLESSLILEQLAEIHYLGNDTLRFLYACLRMLNLAEQAGPTPELARAFAAMGLTAATIPCRRLAESYLRQARETVDRVEHLPSSAWVSLTTGIYHVGIANWECARQNLTRAMDLYKQLGDDRNFGTTSTVLGGSYYFAGNFREGLRIWSEHHERSQRRDDVLHQAWGHGGCALNLLRLGDFPETISRAEAALAMFEVNTDRISEIMVEGVLAVARLREHDLEAAVSEAAAVFEKLRRLGRPTTYLLLEGYSAVVEIRLANWQSETQDSRRKKIQAGLRSAFKQMKTYAYIFPIGKPRFLLWQGEWARLLGHREKAMAFWRKSLVAAEDFDMLYEQALAHWHLAQHHSDPDLKHQHQKAALDLFTQTEAAYDLKLVQDIPAPADVSPVS